MSDGGLGGRRTIAARCSQHQGFVDYEDVGFYDREGNPIEVFDRHGHQLSSVIPVVFRWSCRNPRCGERIPEKVRVHRTLLYGTHNRRGIGEVWTAIEGTRPVDELIQYLPPERVRHIERG